MGKTPLSVYIHIPFCVSKCIYCDFASFANCDEGRLGEYASALRKDIKKSEQPFQNFEVKTVFFGGGTPSLLKIGQLRQILDALQESFDINTAHFSIEANPDTVDAQYLKDLRQLGFRRISFGVQSFNDAHLASIGRIHDAQTAINAVKMAHNAGFADINVDLMYSLPHQTLADFEKSLDIAISLPITHLSCYSLTVEDNTPLASEQYSPLRLSMPDEDKDREFYVLAIKKLLDAGFEHYEISNWTKKGYECRHNIGYWTHRQYIGFGLSAASFIDGKRLKKSDNIDGYIGGDFAFQILEKLNEAALMAEHVVLGLRMIGGISQSEFTYRFNHSIHDIFGSKIAKFIKSGLLLQDGDKIALTPKGIDLSNTIFSDII